MANRWGEQLARLQCFDHAVLDELPGQLVLRVQDLAFVVQAFDLETCLATDSESGVYLGGYLPGNLAGAFGFVTVSAKSASQGSKGDNGFFLRVGTND